MKTQTLKLASLTCIAMSLVACSTTLELENQKRVEKGEQNLAELMQPTAPSTPTIHEGGAPLEFEKLSDSQQLARQRNWLRLRKVTFLPKVAVPANEILKVFREKGINITTTLPLDAYSYNGNGVRDMDGETALQLILGQMGLDFDVDDKGQYITVTPMKSRTWMIPLGNRTSNYVGSSFSDICEKTTSSSSSSTSSTSSPQPYSSAAGGAGQSADSSTGGTGNGSIQSKTEFWINLKAELDQRLAVLIPTGKPASALDTVDGNSAAGQKVPSLSNPMAGQVQQVGSYGMYSRQIMGTKSVNPETGAVTVQAPSWMLKQIDGYMKDVLATYNTSITFEGTIVNVRSNNQSTRGFDLSALASYAGKYGIAVSNNILGGVTMNLTNGAFSASYGNAAALPGAGALLGVVSPADNLQIFNGFLKTVGGAEVVNRPILTVTSGMPADFGRLTPIFTNEPTQELSSGNVNSNAVAIIKNNIVQQMYGSILRIMPTYDVQQRRVRAQISLVQKPLVGYTPLTLQILDAKGNIQPQQINKPVIECMVTSTEAILDDGEMIVIGGQVENMNDNSKAGMMGLMDISGIDLFTSQRRDNGTKSTMYFAIRVKLNSKAS